MTFKEYLKLNEGKTNEKRIEQIRKKAEKEFKLAGFKYKKFDYSKDYREFEVETPIGKWIISRIEDDAIFTRWDNPKLIVDKMYGVNPHSGKMNYHGKEAKQNFINDIDRISTF